MTTSNPIAKKGLMEDESDIIQRVNEYPKKFPFLHDPSAPTSCPKASLIPHHPSGIFQNDASETEEKEKLSTHSRNRFLGLSTQDEGIFYEDEESNNEFLNPSPTNSHEAMDSEPADIHKKSERGLDRSATDPKNPLISRAVRHTPKEKPIHKKGPCDKKGNESISTVSTEKQGRKKKVNNFPTKNMLALMWTKLVNALDKKVFVKNFSWWVPLRVSNPSLENFTALFQRKELRE